jgi:uncharacterized membrane protein YjdF
VWGVALLRRRLHLHPAHFALFALALVLHNVGALGYYQRSVLGLSFDIYVHFYFAFAATFMVHRYLAHALPLERWPLRAATVVCIMGFGGIHEVVEYASYLALGEKGMLKRTSYEFDTNRDLTNNLLGCALALLVIAIASSAARRDRDLSDREGATARSTNAKK